MTFYEYLEIMPQFKYNCKFNEEMILDIYTYAEVVTWTSVIRGSEQHKLQPCRSGITFKQIPVEQYDEIVRMNRYFSKIYTADEKKIEIEKDFEK